MPLVWEIFLIDILRGMLDLFFKLFSKNTTNFESKKNTIKHIKKAIKWADSLYLNKKEKKAFNSAIINSLKN